MNTSQVVEKLEQHPTYMTMGAGKLSLKFHCNREDIYRAKDIVRNKQKYGTEYNPKDVLFKNKSTSNVLVIGDLHEPFCRNGYLEFCKKIYDKYNCNTVVFIGDLIDNHYSSFHETDPDGHSAAEELRQAKDRISKWYKTFPVAKVCTGNHDNIPIRKNFNAGISSSWIKSISEVLETPGWDYSEEFIMNNVLYTHGVGRKAISRMVYDMTSVVQGHWHSESYINYSVGRNRKMFAMQIGCGVDDKSYAMAYGRFFNKMHINCGIVLENGKLPILEYLEL